MRRTYFNSCTIIYLVEAADPLHENNRALLAAYDNFFSAKRFVMWEVDSGVIERATDLRARYGFRTPDAIHLATAIESHAVFVHWCAS